jgi:hypothetical protein
MRLRLDRVEHLPAAPHPPSAPPPDPRASHHCAPDAPETTTRRPACCWLPGRSRHQPQRHSRPLQRHSHHPLQRRSRRQPQRHNRQAGPVRHMRRIQGSLRRLQLPEAGPAEYKR